ncbi:MAG: ParA family protein [Halothiobacillaceae bacterium]|nr:ParA family protein [Halothiobacillaceae bacterium]
MTRIFAIANQKGGVGKTTTAVNLAASLSLSGKRVLLIDLDPQGNSTTACGLDKHSIRSTANELLLGEQDVLSCIHPSQSGDYAVIPANGELTTAEVRLVSKIGREMVLRLALQQISERYDIVLIDCPPALNILTVNALVAAEDVIVPMQCEYFALEGLSALMETIGQVRQAVNPQLAIFGVLRTMYDGRNRLSQDVSQQLEAHFGATLFNTIIPRNVRLAEAPSHGLSVIAYDPSSSGAQAYLELAQEMAQRMTGAPA